MRFATAITSGSITPSYEATVEKLMAEFGFTSPKRRVLISKCRIPRLRILLTRRGL